MFLQPSPALPSLAGFPNKFTPKFPDTMPAIPTAPKPKPKPRTTFFSLPAELRQKILMNTFETHKLHYILHSPACDIDFLPSLNKHSKKCTKANSVLTAVCLEMDGLWDDVRYVRTFWRDELSELLKQWQNLRGMLGSEEEDDCDSDGSDEEEGRVYFDCVETQVVDG